MQKHMRPSEYRTRLFLNPKLEAEAIKLGLESKHAPWFRLHRSNWEVKCFS